jgi:predicted  nucleic acid-binding Zn-ribbon protein
MNEREYKRLKCKAEEAQKDRNRAEGQLEALLGQLEEQFGCSTIDEAEAVLEELKKRAAHAEESYEKAVADFKAEWPDYAED